MYMYVCISTVHLGYYFNANFDKHVKQCHTAYEVDRIVWVKLQIIFCFSYITGIWLHQSGILGPSQDGLVQGEYNGPVHLQRNGQQLLSPDII